MQNLPKPGSPEFKKLIGEGNDTGKKHTTGPPSEAYKNNFDAIFGTPEPIDKKESDFEVIDEQMPSYKIPWKTVVNLKFPDPDKGPKFDDLLMNKYKEAMKAMEANLFQQQNQMMFGDYDQMPPLLSASTTKSPNSALWDMWNHQLPETDYLWEITKKKAAEMQEFFFRDHCNHTPSRLSEEPETFQVGDVTIRSTLSVCWECEDRNHQQSIERTK